MACHLAVIEHERQLPCPTPLEQIYEAEKASDTWPTITL